MGRRDSSSDLAGRLGASLTPRVDHFVGPSRARPRTDENSGLFDMGALYTEALGQVMQRARDEIHLAPLARARPRATEVAWPPPASWQPPASWAPAQDFAGLSPGAARAFAPDTIFGRTAAEYDLGVPIEFVDDFPSARPRGLGWFGVAVAWLATVTMSALLATTVPAHAFPRSRFAASFVSPASVAGAPVAGPIVIASPDVAWTAVPTAQPSPSPPLPAIPPVAATVAVIQAPTPALSSVKATPRPPVTPVVHARSRPLPAASPAPAVALATPASASPAAVAVAPSSRPSPEKPRPAPAPVSTANMSLDDLIRHEVQAESAKTHR